LIVSEAERVRPLNVALIVAVVLAVTAPVLIVNVADDAPAATVTDAGTLADALLLARVTTVADGAVALSRTVLPPVTEVALNVKDESESGGGVVAPGVPAGIKTLEGTESTAELLLDTVNVNPFAGATPALKLIRTSVVFPAAPMIGNAMSGRPSRLKSPAAKS
jgi:hypothetical protein